MCARTLWMAPDSVFVDALMIYLKAIILQIFRVQSWFGLEQINKRKYAKKPILANLGTRISKNLFGANRCGAYERN